MNNTGTEWGANVIVQKDAYRYFGANVYQAINAGQTGPDACPASTVIATCILQSIYLQDLLSILQAQIQQHPYKNQFIFA